MKPPQINVIFTFFLQSFAFYGILLTPVRERSFNTRTGRSATPLREETTRRAPARQHPQLNDGGSQLAEADAATPESLFRIVPIRGTFLTIAEERR